MTRATERVPTDARMTAQTAERTESRGRLLEFPVGRKTRRSDFVASEGAQPRARSLARPVQQGPSQIPRERFLRAIEMEQRGFTEGAISHLRTLHREVSAEADPCLAISIHYFLGSFLMLRGETEKARELAEDGIILAWEHGASEELELLENLSQQLEG